ncbi:hypothetical protein CAEBREN_14163 [Caenorhabditis brenneri]|uniref:Nanos-type domain-containing protein n=1 Tax=Caenorhabditis brenneri TaxID=135651 RepID=G0MQ27_CAEBE|nr:hypothetical protein CAEBREN_14163 [Caenorhabditis brenneri]
MIDINYHFMVSRPPVLPDLLDQNFAAEFRPQEPSPPTPPPAVNPHGHIGQERQPPPTSAPRNSPVPMGPEWGLRVMGGDVTNNHIIINHPERQQRHQHRRRRHHQQQQQQQQNPAPLRATEPAPQEEHRRPCCCFCYGRARVEAGAAGRPIPSKDDDGPWSGHHSITDGVVVCPVLFRVVCGICGATGANAHTTDHHIAHPDLF